MRKVKIFNILGVITVTTLILASTVFSTPMGVTQLTTDKWSTDWRPYGAYVDEIMFVVYSEGQTPLSMLALANGDIDAYDERVLQDYVSALVIDPDVQVTFTPSVRYRALTLDCSHFPLNVTAFRRAIAFGFDKYRANQECIGGVGMPQDSYIPLISTEWQVESKLPTKFYESDFIEGNKSLENAGFKDLDGDGWREYDANGNGLWDVGIDREDNAYTEEGGIMSMFATAGYDPAIIACQIAAEGLENMGIKSEVIEMDFAAIFDLLFAGDAWVACWTEGVPRVNTVKLLYDNFAIGGQNNVEPNNYYHFTNQTISDILNEMVSSNNIAFIKEKAAEASLMLAFEQPQIVCYNDVNIGAHRTDKFEGFFESAGAGWTSGDNWAAATKVRLKESEGGPYGGKFKYCLSDNMNTLNPYLQKTGYEATVFQYIYETLWNVHPNTWDPMPGLAYDWTIETTTASGDILAGQKFTFYLYENETWHDGTPFTSADVNHSIYMWRDSPFVNPEMDDIYKIVLPDAYTIELYVDKAGFFEFADTTSFYITPQHIWKDVTNVTFYTPSDADMIGTGPYYMNARVPGEYISLLRHTGWRWDIRDLPVPPTQETTWTSIPTTVEETTTTETIIPCEPYPPVVTISGIKDEGTYSGQMTIDVSATDDSDIVKAEIRIKGGDFDVTHEVDLDFEGGITWSGSYELDTTDFPDDTYDIIISVYDSCGNKKTIRMDTTFDNGIDHSKESGTQGIPSLSPGFEKFSVFLSLGTITMFIWRRRRK